MPRILNPQSGQPERRQAGIFEAAQMATSFQSMTTLTQGLPLLFNALRLLRQNALLILCTGVLSAVCVFGITYLMSPTYKATALVLLNDDQAPAVPFETGVKPLPAIERRDNTQLQIARSRGVALKVFESTALAAEPEVTAAIRSGVPAAADGAMPTEQLSDAEQTALLRWYFDRLDISTLPDSALMQVSFEASDPALAARVANQVVESFIGLEMGLRSGLLKEAGRRLQNELAQTRRQLDESEQKLQAYRAQQSMSGEMGSEGSASRQVAQLNEQLVSARLDRALLAQQVAQLDQADSATSPPAVLLDDPLVAQAREGLDRARAELARNTASFGSAHPSHETASELVRNARIRLGRALSQASSALRSRYELALRYEESLTQSLNDAKARLLDKDFKLAGMEQIQQEVSVNRALLQSVLTRLREINATDSVQTPAAGLVDAAVVPDRPVTPRTLLLVSVGLLLGLATGIVIALMRTLTDRTIRTVADAEHSLASPVVGIIPEFTTAWRRSRGKLVSLEPLSLFSQSIRATAARIVQEVEDLGRGVSICITSGSVLEGKSTIACNLAVQLSQDRKVLLIDADLYRRRAGALMGVSPRAGGLTQIFRGEVDIQSLLRKGKGSSLTVLAAGPSDVGEEPPCSLSQFRVLLRAMETKYDLIIVDAPPIEAVPDSQLIASACSHSLFVLRGGHTATSIAQRALNRLQQVNKQVIGVIINRHDFDAAKVHHGELAPLWSAQSYLGYRAKAAGSVVA